MAASKKTTKKEETIGPLGEKITTTVTTEIDENGQTKTTTKTVVKNPQGTAPTAENPSGNPKDGGTESGAPEGAGCCIPIPLCVIQ